MGASRCRRDRMYTRFLAGRSRTMPVQHFSSAANCVYSSSSSSAALFRSEASLTARRLPVSALTVLFWCDATGLWPGLENALALVSEIIAANWQVLLAPVANWLGR